MGASTHQLRPLCSPADSISSAIRRPTSQPSIGAWLHAFVHRESSDLHFVPLIGALLLVSALDVLLTGAVISRGGQELNPVANLILQHWDMSGLTVFKYAIVTFYIVVVQEIAARQWSAARLTMLAGVAISALPVAWSTYLLVS
ncbi:MAG: DUF5658 family protein [Planctomycetota bacterium]|nr:DUF5658 family protein [Planctomycetota bacterium]MDA1106372.1 DUF5658 family protein [Planctomycetota bacterium]